MLRLSIYLFLSCEPPVAVGTAVLSNQIGPVYFQHFSPADYFFYSTNVSLLSTFEKYSKSRTDANVVLLLQECLSFFDAPPIDLATVDDVKHLLAI